MRKLSTRCRVCGEQIELEAHNAVQRFFQEIIFDLKLHFHYKSKHQYGFFTKKGLIKRVGALCLLLLIFIVVMPIFLITYPFWWIHDKLFFKNEF
jgi:hypothetical protein